MKLLICVMPFGVKLSVVPIFVFIVRNKNCPVVFIEAAVSFAFA